MKTTAQLKTEALSLGAIFGQTHGNARPEAHRRSTVAKIAYRAATAVEECTGQITQEDADYICSVISDRIKAGAE